MLTSQRCGWAESDPVMQEYHDNDWGILYPDEGRVFEYLVLATFQMGLPWSWVIKRQEGFRMAFAGFDPLIVAKYGEAEVETLLGNPKILRNRMKILATIHNAKAFLNLSEECKGQTFAWFLAQVGGKQIVNRWPSPFLIPDRSDLSSKLAVTLKARNFKLLGPVSFQSFLQACGFINDHWAGCPSLETSLSIEVI